MLRDRIGAGISGIGVKSISLADAFAQAEARLAAAFQTSHTVPPLAEFVEQTVQFKLHDWQRNHLCPLLERFKTERGIRLLIHGPPQFGKSIIMSKRFPAWLLANDPMRRIVMAGYNVEHARDQFAEQVRNLMQSDDFRHRYPQASIPTTCSAAAFSTSARAALNDGQDSIVAVGLLSGFTGKGVAPGDALLLDDPYASPDDAKSETINDRVWRFWDDNAKNRVHPEANVAVLFHRYHEADLAGRLLETGNWEHVRFPALGDENEDGSDPTGRPMGEPLSPMWTVPDLHKIELENPVVFRGQWQGTPRPVDGDKFKRHWFSIIDEIPPLVFWVRYWDLAVGIKRENDFTAGALVGVRQNGAIVIADMKQWKREWPDTRDGIRDENDKEKILESGIIGVAAEDYELLGTIYDKAIHKTRPRMCVGVESPAAHKGYIQDLQRNDLFLRIPLHPIKPEGDKLERSATWRARGSAVGIQLVRDRADNRWNEKFIKECLIFDGKGLTHDDMVDAVSGAIELLYAQRGAILEEHKPIKANSQAFIDELVRRAG